MLFILETEDLGAEQGSGSEIRDVTHSQFIIPNLKPSWDLFHNFSLMIHEWALPTVL